MVQLGLMIEGQDGLNWERWQRVLRTAQERGFGFVFRSDHFTNPEPPDKDSLELWTSLTYAAGHTERIEFGSLVTPVTFRHPSITARMAAAVDDLSGGRLVLGIGAGWQDREHRVFGVPFPPTNTRFKMLEEYLEVVTRLLRSDEPVTFAGKHFQLDHAILLPRPSRPGGPRILIGGNGEKRTLPLAARFGDEWNGVFVTPRQFRTLSERLDTLLDEAGRPRAALKRSLMLGTILARDEKELRAKLHARGRTADEVRERGLIVGTPAMWVEQLAQYAEAGVERIMLQWLDQDDLEGIQIIARDVLPAIHGAAAAN